MDDKALLVRSWLIKALHDLAVAKKLQNDEHPILDVAIYHCQQAAEKAVKGFLVWRDAPFPKTHDVRLLVQMAVSINPEFSIHQDAADILTPYATEFRYPGEVMEPTDDEMEEALNHAENVVCFVISLLPEALKTILTTSDT